jgi:fermentation-respiration switch protein FrsA (DUF1100 family)
MARRLVWATLLTSAATSLISCRGPTARGPLGGGTLGGGPAAASAPSTAVSGTAVGLRQFVFNDDQRATPAGRSGAGHPGRRLVTTVWYPATGAAAGRVVDGAPPDRTGAPYPLIVFGHGFTGSGAGYGTLLSRWAAAGYVVAAPDFPLSNGAAPGGPTIADYPAQPGDMSAVITDVEQLSASATSPLHGLVDPRLIGAAGHSLGAMTTLGLTANTCCQDRRVLAAVVLAGDALPFSQGSYTTKDTPATLFVHGDDDRTVPYHAGRDAYRAAAPPKFLVTLEGGGHAGPYVNPADRWFGVVNHTAVAFLDRYLKGNQAALGRLQRAGTVAGIAHEEGVPTGATPSALTPATPPANRTVAVSPSSRLHDGQVVDVAWSGFGPSAAVLVAECSRNPPAGLGDCDLNRAQAFRPSGPDGSGRLPFTVHTGPVGPGQCGPPDTGCVVAVNLGGSPTPGDTVAVSIGFAP